MAGGETCSWCDAPLAAGEGYRAHDPAGARRAAFCRLEHVVPWQISGPHWDAAETEPELPSTGLPERCSECGEPLGAAPVLLVHHRGAHRILDGFCGIEHAAAWARAGGRWR